MLSAGNHRNFAMCPCKPRDNTSSRLPSTATRPSNGPILTAPLRRVVQVVAMSSADDIDEVPSGLTPAAARAYLDARVQGLCHEGALEVALGVERNTSAQESRLETVEFKLAHLERATQELSDVLYRQQQQLDAVHAAQQRLRAQVEEIDGRMDDASPVEIPPHY